MRKKPKGPPSPRMVRLQESVRHNESPACYRPNYVSKPGETIKECLEVAGMTQRELAKRMKRPAEQVNRLINAKIRITCATALQLEKAFRAPAHFWMNLETNYRLHLARKKAKHA